MRQDVKDIYTSNTFLFNSVMNFKYNEDEDKRKHYVYEWYTNSGKVFYVGKGTGIRYKHILKEIEIYEKNKRKYKGKDYKYLKDNYGINYRIVLSDLTECEAIIMENYYIWKYLEERKPLLNIIVPYISDEVNEWWREIRWSSNLLEYFK